MRLYAVGPIKDVKLILLNLVLIFEITHKIVIFVFILYIELYKVLVIWNLEMNSFKTPIQLSKQTILQKCRGCLNKNGIDVDSTKWRIMEELFEKYTGIKIMEKECFPNSLCSDCIKSLLDTHKFIIQCKTSESFLCMLESMWDSKTSKGFIAVVMEKPNQDISIIREKHRSEMEAKDLNSNTVEVEHSDIPNMSSVGGNRTQMEKNFEYCYRNSDHTYCKLPFTNNCVLDNASFNSNCDEQQGNDDLVLEEIEISKAITDVTAAEANIVDCAPVDSEVANEKDKNEKTLNTDDNFEIKIPHKRKYKPPKNKFCYICKKAFNRKSLVKAHIRSHTKEKPYECHLCSTKFSSRTSIIRHQLVHTGEKPYICHFCGKGSTQWNILKKHMESHITGNKTTILCSFCGATFGTEQAYKYHIKNLHREEDEKLKEGTVVCRLCDRIIYKVLLNQHLLSNCTNPDRRNNKATLICSNCGKAFKSPSLLKKHMLTHLPKNERPYMCEVCGKRFINEKILKVHNNMHIGLKPYKCKTCDTSFYSNSQLHYHQSTHSNIQHSCEVCGKIFITATHLRTHALIHTGQKPFTCQYCQKGYSTNGNLKQHLMLHAKETLYHCAHCDKGFKIIKNLRTHMRIHTKHKSDVFDLSDLMEHYISDFVNEF